MRCVFLQLGRTDPLCVLTTIKAQIDLDFIYNNAEACVYEHILTWGDFIRYPD